MKNSWTEPKRSHQIGLKIASRSEAKKIGSRAKLLSWDLIVIEIQGYEIGT